MAREFEIIGVGAIGALLQRKAKHAPEPGAICANCDTELAGPYCHVCGQDADDHHRSIAHLSWEGVEGLTHLDGRLAQSLPQLLFEPGRLARDHLEGRRARHVPPFRLFLISLLIFMFVLESLFHPDTAETADRPVQPPDHVTIIEAAKGQPGVVRVRADPQAAELDMLKVSQEAQQDSAIAPEKHTGDHASPGTWLREHIKRAKANQEYYKMVLFTWAHRLAILLLPILAGLLALAYRRERKFFIYDHLIVAMQFLSFVFLIFALAWLAPFPLNGLTLLAATLWTPVNLYMTLRGAYGSGVITAGVKTLFLWVSTLLLFLILIVALLALALAQM
jgi:hypothetical protein